MARVDKILEKLLRGTSDANMSFEDVCYLLSVAITYSPEVPEVMLRRS
jgi:hypothetical protein